MVESNRNVSLDIFKLLFAFFVIGIHTRLLNDVNEHLSFVLTQGLFRIAVPFFILITGYYFVNIQTQTQLFHWSIRLFVLYIFWTVIYFPLWNIESSFLVKLILVLNGFEHIWYIVHMLIAGIIFFYLKRIPNFNPFILAALLFTIGCTIQYYVVYFENDFTNKFFRFFTMSYRNFAFVCIPFFSIGYLLNTSKIKLNRGFFLISILLFILEVSLNWSFSRNATHPVFDLLFSLLFLVPCLFLFIKGLKINLSHGKLISLFASSVYFSHIWVISVLIHFGQNGSVNRWIITICISLLISIPLIYLNNKLKYKII